jgi:hypothetical protein
MTTPSPKGFNVFYLSPCAAQKLQEKIIADLRAENAKLIAERDNSQLGGAGATAGGILGIPTDTQLANVPPENSVKVENDPIPPQPDSLVHHEGFANKYKYRPHDKDPAMPSTLDKKTVTFAPLPSSAPSDKLDGIPVLPSTDDSDSTHNENFATKYKYVKHDKDGSMPSTLYGGSSHPYCCYQPSAPKRSKRFPEFRDEVGEEEQFPYYIGQHIK